MLKPIVWVFLGTSIIFALVHQVAMASSLYWFYDWFDIFMHTWGGVQLALGVHAFCTFSKINIKPTFWLVLYTLAIATLAWEVFEFNAGLYDPETHSLDTLQDILLGFTGGLLTHFFLRDYTISTSK